MIEDELTQYGLSLTRAYTVTEVGSHIIQISVSAIEKIASSSSENSVKLQAKNQAEMLRNVLKSPVLSDSANVVSGQQIVLMVTAMEVFLSDVVRKIGNNYREKILWADDSNGKVDLSLISNSAVTVGDIFLSIVVQKGINFQDLQSTKRFFKSYLDVQISLSVEDEEIIILATAIRHSIVHCGSKIGNNFIKQVRNTSYAKDYKYGELIEVDQQLVKDTKETFNRFGRKIASLLCK